MCLDVIAMVGTIVCLNLAAKYYKAWLWYLIPTSCFIILMLIKGVPGQLVMGLFLFCTGVRNYLIGRRKFNAEER